MLSWGDLLYTQWIYSLGQGLNLWAHSLICRLRGFAALLSLLLFGVTLLACENSINIFCMYEDNQHPTIIITFIFNSMNFYQLWLILFPHAYHECYKAWIYSIIYLDKKFYVVKAYFRTAIFKCISLNESAWIYIFIAIQNANLIYSNILLDNELALFWVVALHQSNGGYVLDVVGD